MSYDDGDGGSTSEPSVCPATLLASWIASRCSFNSDKLPARRVNAALRFVNSVHRAELKWQTLAADDTIREVARGRERDREIEKERESG